MKLYLLTAMILLAACGNPSTTPPKAGTDTLRTADTFHPPDFLLSADSNENDLVPPYGLDHVESLIAKIHQDTSGDSDFDDQYMALDSNKYAALPLREKFTYNMLQNEAHHQNCDIIPEHTDEAHRIYGGLKATQNDEDGWSERQAAYFKNNRDSVMVMIRECVAARHFIGNNTMDVINYIEGKELIPFIIEAYKNEQPPKDHYILTLLLLLMESGKYPEMIHSESHQKLYGDNAKAGAYLDYNKPNEDLIIQRATKYYNGLAKK